VSKVLNVMVRTFLICDHKVTLSILITGIRLHSAQYYCTSLLVVQSVMIGILAAMARYFREYTFGSHALELLLIIY